MNFFGEEDAELVDDAANVPNAAGLDAQQQANATAAKAVWPDALIEEPAPPPTAIVLTEPAPWLWCLGMAGLVFVLLGGAGKTVKLSGFRGRKVRRGK
jgi:hypothetical protein